MKQNINIKNENNENSINSHEILSDYNEEDSEITDWLKEPEDYNDEEDISVEINGMKNNHTNASTIKAKDHLY